MREKGPPITIAQPANWAISQQAQTNGLYALSLVDVNDLDNVASNSTNDVFASTPLEDLTLREFAFVLPPKSFNMDEPAAVQIIPTQDGQFVEHQGQIYKNIQISGTTGLRPNRKAGGIIPILGIPESLIAAPDIDTRTGLPFGERTGFDDLIALRNVCRAYLWAKSTPALSSRVLMVWQNGKEGEYYVVEPMTFRTSRDSASPITFNYDIQFRTIERLDMRQFATQKDSHVERTSGMKFFDRINEWTRTLQTGFSIVTALSSRLVGIGQATLDAVLQPLNTLILGLANVTTASSGILAIPRNSVAQLVGNSLELANALDSYKNELNAYNQFGIMTQQAFAARTARSVGRTCANIATENRLFDTPLGVDYSRKAAAYISPVTGMPRSGGSPTSPSLIRPPVGTAVATVNDREDIRGAALRLLGDVARWRELVLLNKLKPPYISDAGDGLSVLRAGDRMLYPKAAVSDAGAVKSARNTTDDPIVTRLGRDIRLTSTGTSLLDTVVVNGDLGQVEGIENMNQAVMNRFATEPRKLPTHPSYGFRYPLGTKATYRSLTAFKLAGRASLLADSRVADASDFSMQVTGNVLRVKATLKLQGISDTYSTDFAVRR
jgi:hypothetical protein